MQIYLYQNEQQVGPFDETQIRATVASGAISQSDIAWHDGLSEWQPLNTILSFSPPASVPPPPRIAPQSTPSPVACPTCGAPKWRASDPCQVCAKREPQVIHVVTPSGTPAASNSPVSLVSGAHESEIWKGNPSQLLNLGHYIGWAIFLLISFLVAIVTAAIPDGPKGVVWLVFCILVFICVLQSFLRVLKIKSTRYEITNQRVRVVRGIFSKDIQEIELFRVKDTSAHQTIFLRIFGLGNVKIMSGDATNPLILLQAVPKAMQLREQLRQEVLSLRQKFGVRELDVMQGN